MLKIESGIKARARRQAGFVVTVELLLITVILVVGLVTGMTKVRDQTLAELSDTGQAIGVINQGYQVDGTYYIVGTEEIAAAGGWAFADQVDAGIGNSVGGDTSIVQYRPASVGNLTETSEYGGGPGQEP